MRLKNKPSSTSRNHFQRSTTNCNIHSIFFAKGFPIQFFGLRFCQLRQIFCTGYSYNRLKLWCIVLDKILIYYFRSSLHSGRIQIYYIEIVLVHSDNQGVELLSKTFLRGSCSILFPNQIFTRVYPTL